MSERFRLLFQMGGMTTAGHRSGMHRVSVELARALHTVAEVDFVLWDAQERTLRYAGVSDLDAMFGPGGWPAGVEVRPEARRLGAGTVDFTRGAAQTWLLDPEIAYHSPGGVEGLRLRTRQARQLGIRTAAVVHDLIPIRRPDYAEDREVHAAYIAELAHADLLIAISQHTARDIAAYWSETGLAPVPIRTCLLPDGGFGGAPEPRAPTDGPPFHFLMVGTVEPRKRQLETIEAFAQARRTSAAVADATLTVIGALSGKVERRFRQLLRRTPGVTYLGQPPDWRLAAALSATSATIFASEDEGFGLPIAESLAAGAPCLCADFGAMAEVAAGGGCLQMDVRAPGALQAAIVSFCEDAELRGRLRGEIARRQFRSWPDFAHALIRHLAEAPPAAARPLDDREDRRADWNEPGTRTAPPDVAYEEVTSQRAPQASRTGNLPRRGVALARRGLRKIARLAFGSLVRRGPHGAGAFGTGDLRRGSHGGRERALDRSFALPEAEWRAWLAGRRANRLPSERRDPRAPIRLQLHIEGDDPARLALTRASWARLNMAQERHGDSLRIAGADPADLRAPRPFHLFLHAGDRLDPDFGVMLSRTAAVGGTDLVSFDLFERDGDRVRPLFLPGANPTFATSAPSLYGRFAVSDTALPDGWEGLSGAEVLQRWMATLPAGEHLRRWRHACDVPRVEIEQSLRRPLAAPSPKGAAPDVSVVICTKDKGHLVRQLARTLLDTQASVRELIVVSNNTTSAHALATLEALGAEPRVRLVRCDEPFNFSRLANLGAARATCPTLAFLNDDIVPVSEDWLDGLNTCLGRPKVGAVGPLLLYPNERVQEAGMHLGFHGIAGHTLRHAALPGDEYMFLASAAREVSSVTGAVLLTPRWLFQALGGFDERLATYLQDVDYCLRVREGGFAVVFEPASVLIHLESMSVSEIADSDMGRIRTPERSRFIERWGALLEMDPLFPQGLDPNDETLRTLRGPCWI